ncbi:HAD domain-containing protein [Cupriavidus basilensis]|uniref:HAD domain-containing protein n=1 Tax=Cupriavidus basilensis TaxID=68895 RepID=UPI00130EE8BB
MPVTLYLNTDGVLHPRPVTFESGRTPHLRSPGHRLFENAERLEELLLPYPDTRIVLHSWWPFFIGYQHAVQHLPPALRARVVGSTLPGNRLLRFHLRNSCVRREWLRCDLRRRSPSALIVLDSDWNQVLPETEDVSLIATSEEGLREPQVYAALVRLLRTVGIAG